MREPVMSVAEVQAFLEREFPQMAGEYVVEEVGPMRARIRTVPEERHLRPGGTVSGPTLFALADCAMYLCLMAMIGPEALAVTTSASIDFMRKPEAGRALVADVELLKLGRALAVGEVRIRPEGGTDPVARASMTYSRPR